MSDQTVEGLIRRAWGSPELVIAGVDRAVLRDLAARAADLAARPCEDTKRHLWYRHNALEATRPLIFCDPEVGWNEILTDEVLQCRGELARVWEVRLRKEIFWGESMGDDRPIEPYFDLSHVHEVTDWGMHDTRIGGGDGGAYRWEAPLKSLDDIGGLSVPRITVDSEASEQLLSLANEVVGGSLTVRLKGQWWWSLGMTTTLAALRGLEQILYDMMDDQAGLHRLMTFLRDATMAKVDYLEDNGLLSLNNDGTYVGSGGFGYSRELPGEGVDSARGGPRDMWGFSESQETSTVSPEMFDEFIFQYQLPILERFGLNCYGCCEPLDRRWDVVKKTPRLRRVSVSAWCDLACMAEKLGSRYIYSMKPNPADLARAQLDEAHVRKGLREALRATRGCRVEVIMKDNHTIGNNPRNVIRWCRIAREEAESL